MKIEELRIGNWVMGYHDPFQWSLEHFDLLKQADLDEIIKEPVLITGGAIKIVKAMQDHHETKSQLSCLKTVEQCLTHEGVKCSSQFYELLKFKESIRK